MKIKNSSLLEIFSGKYKVLDDKDEVLFYLNKKMNITKINKKNPPFGGFSYFNIY